MLISPKITVQVWPMLFLRVSDQAFINKFTFTGGDLIQEEWKHVVLYMQNN